MKKKEADILKTITEDWNCTLAANFEDVHSYVNPTQNQITVSNCTTSYPIPKPTKPSKATKKQHLTRNCIKKVIFSNPTTIVFWDDGSKTVVKCSKRDNFDPEKGLAMAFAKRCLGNKSNYYNTFVKYIPELRDEHDSSEVVSR